MSLSPLRVARDALRGAALFVVGAHAAVYADADGLQSTLSPTIASWENFIIFILGFVIFCLVIGAIFAAITRGWGAAATTLGVAVALGFVTAFRDAII